jgi:carbamate kinase
MAPKVTAAADFVTAGRMAGIGRLEDAGQILKEQAGTRISL